MHILLIEPDQILAKTIRSYLSSMASVYVSSDSQSAITAADQRRPDVIILELNMPQHNGVAFLQEFRSYTDWTRIPIIIYSHIPQSDTGLSEQEWAKLGIVSYLYKPTSSLQALSDAVDRASNSLPSGA